MKMQPEHGIFPDSWVLLEINHEGKKFKKILAGWSGGYLDGDSWRMSSPIKTIDIDVDNEYIVAKTASGSTYTLWKNYQGLRMSNAGVYNQLKEKFGDSVKLVDILGEVNEND